MLRFAHLLGFVRGFGLICWLAPAAATQCANVWLPGNPLAGIDGHVRTTMNWDPDGAGPAPLRVVFGGTFTAAGAVVASGVATWEPSTGAWTALGTGVTSTGGVLPEVHALASMQNGDLVVAGRFTTAGGVAATNVARWNGTAWAALGSGQPATIRALAAMPNGDLIAGGSFPGGLARWDGSTWSTLGASFAGTVNALLALPNGQLLAGGDFTAIGASPVAYLASWNGTAWAQYAGGTGGPVTTVTPLPNGDLVVSGSFVYVPGVFPCNRVARWNGSTWSPMGSGVPGPAAAAVASPSGHVLLAHAATTSGILGNNILQWNGTVWSSVGGGMPSTQTVSTLVVLPNGDVVAGGAFVLAGGNPVQNVARWNGAAWSALTAGTDSEVHAVLALPNGDLIAGGGFTMIAGTPVERIARRPAGSAAWQGLAPAWSYGLPVECLLALPDGRLLVGGGFEQLGGWYSRGLAVWDGAAWSGMGLYTPTRVRGLAARPDGSLVAVGTIVMNWGGTPVQVAIHTTFWQFGFFTSGNGNWARAAATTPVGGVVIGGSFAALAGVPASNVAHLSGTTVTAMGAGTDGPVHAVCIAANGDVLVGGDFTTAGGAAANSVARWNGAAWSPFGSGLPGGVRALHELPNGDVVATGSFPGLANLARWNGNTWSIVAGGTSGEGRSLATLPNGDLVVGGAFATAGGAPAAYIASLTTSCPATAVASGAGCASTGGANTLAATSLPWVGSTFRALATGLPAAAIVVAATGFTPIAPGTLPLAAVLPQGQPGCDLLVSPDFLELSLTTTGSARSQLVLPNLAALVGVTVHHQMIPMELDGLGNIVAITATNRLAVVMGAF